MFPSGGFGRLKNFDQKFIDLVSFQEHPSKGGKEEVMQQNGDECACASVFCLLNAKHENDFSS